jgi:beta-glucosidase/6-phospho-beta-glucosidase/beta-galactosidase
VIEHGVDSRGDMCWSLMDNFEWAYGYTKRFGLHWVDFATGERRAKSSATFYGKVAQDNALPDEGE